MISRGQGFGEHGRVIVHMVGHFVQVARGQDEIVREAAVAILDAEHGAVAAVFFEAGLAHVASATDAVDLADDALADPFFMIAAAFAGRGVLDDADEFVAEHTFVTHVALGDFQVGGADAHAGGADEHFAGAGLGLGAVVNVFDLFAVEDDCLHGEFPLMAGVWVGGWACGRTVYALRRRVGRRAKLRSGNIVGDRRERRHRRYTVGMGEVARHEPADGHEAPRWARRCGGW